MIVGAIDSIMGVQYPIPVYLELGEKEKKCSKPRSGFDNDKIKKIKKII